MKRFILYLILLTFALQNTASAQYNLVWNDEFDGTSLNSVNWNVEEKIGVWNTQANKELQHYKAENVEVGSDGNGNNCLILTAKRETYNGYSFTSGKVDTKAKFSVRYGKIEARIKVPNLANGLWPAFWLLGYGKTGWPACGEIDVLEMGHANGIIQNNQNKYYSGALHWENNDQYASYGHAEVASVNLNEDYHLYTLEWTPSQIKMFLDNSSTPYYSMDITGADAEEFRNFSDFLIFNLAVGGSFPNILNPNDITATLPAKMFIDYVKVYQKTGEGEIVTSPIQYGNFGVLAEKTTYMGLKYNFDTQINTQNLATSTSSAVYGSFALNYKSIASGNTSLSIDSKGNRNMTRFNTNGALEFYIKTTATEDITVSIKDASQATASFVLNSNFKYNPLRNGTWQKVVIPFSQFTGTINYQSIKTMIELSVNTSENKELSIDEVVWTESATSLDYYGIFTENDGVSTRFLLNDVTGHIFIWNNSMSPLVGAPSYEGTDVLAFSSNPTAAWYGFGLFDDNSVDLSFFADGYLHLSMKTTSTNEFWIGIGGAKNTEAKITFKTGTEPYGFKRDGLWHNLIIPAADFTAQGIDFTACGNVFMAGGVSISDIAFDEIVFSKTNTIPTNNKLNPNRNSGIGTPDNIKKITADHFAVYSENIKIQERFLIDDVTGHIYIWNNLTATTITPYEGKDVLSFTSGGGTWYGFGIFADKAHDLTHYANGYLHISVKTASTNEFWIGVGGKTEGKITFPSTSEPYGLKRDGKWHKLVIPVADFVAAGLNLSACGNIFMAGGASIADIAFDDIVYSISQTLPVNDGVNPQDGENPYKITNDVYGIFTENPNIAKKFATADGNGNIYIWDGTLTAVSNANIYEGETVLDFASTGKGWYGYGINSKNPLDLTHFANGYLHFAMKTSNVSDNFSVGIEGAGGTQAVAAFTPASNPYGFVRDGNWHKVTMPLSSYPNVILSACGNIFKVVGVANSSIAIDDVVLSKSATPEYNPNLVGTSIELENNPIKVYPNPVLDKVYFEGFDNSFKISVFNISGTRILEQYNIDNSLNMNTLTSGIYILKLENQQKVFQFKIMKQ